MSDPATLQYLVWDIGSGRVKMSVHLAAAVIVIYDHIITFGSEVDLFWKRKFTLSSVLFLANRYLALLSYGLLNTRFVYSLLDVGVLRWSLERCHKYVLWLQLYVLLPYPLWAAFSAMRMYALSGRNVAISGAVFLLACAPFAINMTRIRWLSGYEDVYWGCESDLSAVPPRLILPFILISRISLMIADMTVVAACVRLAWSARLHISHGTIDRRRSFVWVLLRDGAVYFVVMFCLNGLHLVFSASQVLTDIDDIGTSIIPFLTDPITTVLVSRALLNLQRVNQRVTLHMQSSADIGTIHESTLRFATRTSETEAISPA